MKPILFCLFFTFIIQGILSAQINPILRVQSNRNIFTQKTEILDGSRVLGKQEVFQILASDPDALFIYEKARRKQTITSMLSALELGLFATSAYFIIAPQPPSSSLGNLFWPLSIGSVVVSIASGAFRRQATNLTMEAIQVYNFGNQAGPPVYFQENRIDQPIFSFKIPLR